MNAQETQISTCAYSCRHILVFALALCSAVVCAHDEGHAQDTIITPVMEQALPDIDNREVLMLTVEYAPGASTPSHKHDAHTFVYVLEGAIVMQVEGKDVVTLGPGQSYYETPTDIHSVSRNASTTEHAKFLVFFIKNPDTPPVIPVQ